MDSAYILNRHPFRDNRFIVDLLTQDAGRMTCMARVAKKRGKIMKGTLEPFRRLAVDWAGKGQMPTLIMAEEQRRYRIQSQDLCKGLYLNELILKLVPLFAPAQDVFVAYQAALSSLTALVDEMTLMHCEVSLLETLGYSMEHTVDHQHGNPIEADQYYRYSLQTGLRPDQQYQEGKDNSGQEGVLILGILLIKWRQRERFTDTEYNQLRQFLNHFIDRLLEGKSLKSRKLVFI